MPESTRPGAGGNNCYQSMPELKERKTMSTTALTSATSATMVLFYDVNHDAYIVGIDVLHSTAGSGTVGSLDVGTAASPEALVANFSISNASSVGTAENVTLLTTNIDQNGQSANFYKVPAGTPLLGTYTTGGANTGRWSVVTTYVLLDKGI